MHWREAYLMHWAHGSELSPSAASVVSLISKKSPNWSRIAPYWAKLFRLSFKVWRQFACAAIGLVIEIYALAMADVKWGELKFCSHFGLLHQGLYAGPIMMRGEGLLVANIVTMAIIISVCRLRYSLIALSVALIICAFRLSVMCSPLVYLFLFFSTRSFFDLLPNALWRRWRFRLDQ